MEAKDILLADLGHARSLLTANEADGETRVKFLTTLSAAVGAGLVSLHNGQAKTAPAGAPAPELPCWVGQVTIASIAALIAFSLLIYFRILRRNRMTDHYRTQIDHICETARAIAVGKEKIADYDIRWAPKNTGLTAYLRGGYGDMVSLIIGLQTAALFAYIQKTPDCGLAIGALVFLGGAVLQRIDRA